MAINGMESAVQNRGDKTTQIIKTRYDLETEAEVELNKLRTGNRERLESLTKELIERRAKLEIEIENSTAEKIETLRQQVINKSLKVEEKKLGRKLTAAEKKNIATKAAEEFKIEAKEKEKLEKKSRLDQSAKLKAQIEQEGKELGKAGYELWKYVNEQLAENGAMKQGQIERQTNKNESRQKAFEARKQAFSLENFANKFYDVLKKLDNTIDTIGNMKGIIDTRLQGSNKTWTEINRTITGIAAVSPFVKQSAINEKIKEYVGEGINFNVEQRAFLATISEKIADTFNANDSTLRRLIRIQQQDSTAARLGMESAMTAFLNNMYENTEYLKGVADSVRQSIEEASSLMGTQEAVEFEYQVQKWMGSLYSVGFSNTSAISQALGKLAAGDISGITGGGAGNLLVMAANNAGISISEALQQGLDDSDTNRLMQSMVNYLAQIYNESKGSKVLQQQFANVYGLTASDLKAAANLASSTSVISNTSLTYTSAIERLNTMASTIGDRTSITEMMSNIWDNLQYSMAAGIANSPAMYGIYKGAGLLDSLVGGIALPSIMGTGLNTTVADLMRVGALAGGIFSNMGAIGSNLSNSFKVQEMLSSLGINTNLTTVQRGTGESVKTISGLEYSESGYIGNSNGGDIQNKTITQANENLNQQVIEAEESSTEVTNNVLDEHIVNIYALLQNVTSGTSSFTVKFEDILPWNQ